MNIRILAASALALAILVPAANAETPLGKVTDKTHSGFDKCPGGDAYMNLGTGECVQPRVKVIHAWAIKHVARPVSARKPVITYSYNKI